ncbi:threonine dehydratase [Tindallia magadiensis]|uniref:threonine ammonia-lyase n=1 Tax=Tindallia magadiensis TaxID=69895 RepID=A0A1I3C2R9_9FIRM|nr:pyridoxal-phosphate dependent enzyme [Tindallia magadiensis]SFH68479.1 threonine dehydratase [Tindallia magadiensis]
MKYESLKDWKSLCLQDVFLASKRIHGLILKTPLIESPDLALRCGAHQVFVKLESLQNTGAFKLRGAGNKILSLEEEDRQKGVITFSTGNHGRAVAYTAAKLGIKAVVCLSEKVPQNRVEMIKALKAEPVVFGKSQDEAEDHFEELIRRDGYISVPPFDDPEIIAGQGTVVLEMLQKNPQIDTLLVQLSGGGLLAGTALVAKSIKPKIKIIGVSIQQSPAMLESLKVGKPVDIEEKATIAGSLSGGIGRKNEYTLPLIEHYVDEHVLITEEEVIQGMKYAFEKHQLVAEGAAVVGISALLNHKVDVTGKKVGIMMTGSCVESKTYLEIIGNSVD